MKFRLVDRILNWQPRESIHGVKAVSFEEYELRRRLGDEPCLPESLIMESLFQLGNWLLILSSDFQQMGLVVRFEEVRFSSRVRPGSSTAAPPTHDRSRCPSHPTSRTPDAGSRRRR